MGPKKKPKTIKSNLFTGSSPITVDDLSRLQVDSFGPQAAVLLDDLNWSQEVIALTGLKLAPDNRRILSSSVFLLGSIFEDKSVNAANFWNLESATSLILSIPDSSIFSFPNGSLCSEFLDSSSFKYSFKQGETTLSKEAQAAAGIHGFSLRALLMPISATFTRIWITLVPISLASLLADHPLATNPAFPSIKLIDGDVPLGPPSDGPPLSKGWGCPITPAVILGAPLDEAPNVPQTSAMIAAISAMLRKAVRPEIVQNSTNLYKRMQSLLDHGVSKLKDQPVDFIWPLPVSSVTSPNDSENDGSEDGSLAGEESARADRLVEDNASSGEDSEVPSISSVLSTRSVLVSRLNKELPGARKRKTRSGRSNVASPTRPRGTVSAANKTSKSKSQNAELNADSSDSVKIVSKNRKGKKNKKRKTVADSSSRSSNSQSESETDKVNRKRSYSSSSGSSGGEDQRGKSNYDVLKDVLPGEARLLRNQKTKINQMRMSEVLDLVKLKRAADQANIGEAASRFSKDKPPKPRRFREETDDSVKLLHKARFLRAPLSDIKKWWKLMPAARSHVYKTIPLKFSGSQSKLSEKTIGFMHDRAKALSIKNFHSQNACVAAKPMKKIERKDAEGLVTLFDYSWEEPSSLAEFTEALINYIAAMQQLWPLDPTGIIMLRLINTYKWISVAYELKEKIAVLSSYFNGVLQENAGRAIRGEVILDYKEHEDILKLALTSHNLSSAVPTGRNPRADQDLQARAGKKSSASYVPNSSGFSSGHSSNFRKDGQNQRPKASFNGLGVCYTFNNGSCKSPSTPSGCKGAGRELAHVCNVYVQQKSSFCLGKHPRTSHKF